MPLDYDELNDGVSKAKDAGYSDEQIYAHLASQDEGIGRAKEAGYSLGEVLTHISKKGGETNVEEQNQPQAQLVNGPLREAQEQRTVAGDEAQVQTAQQRVLPHGEELLREYNAGQGQRDGDSVQLKEGEVPGGVRPSPEKKGSAIVAGLGSLAEATSQIAGYGWGARIGGAIGGLIAAPIAAAEEVGTAGLATPLAVGTEVGGSLIVGWLGGKLEQGIEKLLGIHGSVEKAKQDNPMLSNVIGAAAMLPLASKSATNLLRIGAEEGGKGIAKAVGTGAAVGGGFYPLQVGVDNALNYITDSKEHEDLTWKGAAMSVGTGALLSGLGLNETRKAIETGGKDDAAKTKLKEAAKDPHGPLEDAFAQAEQHIEDGNHDDAEAALAKAKGIHDEIRGEDSTLEGNRDARYQHILNGIEQGRKGEGEAKTKPETTTPEPPKEGPAPAPERYLTQAEFRPEGWKEGDERFTGANHDEALQKALDAKKITQDQFDDLSGNNNAGKRNDDRFGFSTNKGEFVSRSEGNQIAKDAGQHKIPPGQKMAFEGLLHSHEVEFNPENFAANAARISEEAAAHATNAAAEAPKDPSQAATQNWWQKKMAQAGWFRDDLKAMGAKGVAKNIAETTKNGFSYIRDAMGMAADIMTGQVIPQLTKAGVKFEATQHAYSRWVLKPMVNKIIAEVFPDTYKMSAEGKKVIADIDWRKQNAERELDRIKKYGLEGKTEREKAMIIGQKEEELAGINKEMEAAVDKHDLVKKTIDVIVKDNILGGHDMFSQRLAEKQNRLDELNQQIDAGTAERGAKSEVKSLTKYIEDLKYAIGEIEKQHDIAQYEKDVLAAKGTKIEEDIKRWKDIVNPKMDELYKKANNTDKIPETERGRHFGARINLLSKAEEGMYLQGEKEDGAPKPVLGVNYRNPDIKQDVLAQKAFFNKQYSTDAEAILKNAFGRRLYEGSKLDLYKSLIKNGYAIIPEKAEDVSTIGGKRAVRMPVEMPEVNEETGYVRMVEKNMYVREDINEELKRVLDVNERGGKNPIANFATQIQLVGLGDFIAHGKNILSVVNYTLGRDSQAKDLLSKIPFLNTANTIKDIMKVMKEIREDSPEIRKEMYEIANLSGLRPHYDAEGVMRMLSKFQHDTLYEMDTAARIIMNRRYNNLVKNFKAENTPEARIDFVNQIGEYNRRLMNRWEAGMRDVGLSPFVVAGRAMNRMGRRIALASPGFKTEDSEAYWKARGIQISGLVMSSLVPATVNLLTTGNMFGRPGTPVGAIDFGPNFDTPDGKKRVFDLFQLMGIRRGMRQLGINAAIEGLKNGDSWQNIQQNSLNDFFTSSLHPFIGPGLGLGVATLTGKRIDMRTGLSDMYVSRKVGGAMQYLENFRAGIKQQNEFLYGAGVGGAIETAMKAAGIPSPVEQNESQTLRQLGLSEHTPILSQLYTATAQAASALGGKTIVTPALKLSAQLGSKQQYSPEQDIRYKYRRDIMDAVQAKNPDKAAQIFQEGVRAGYLTKADEKVLKGKIKQPDILLQRVSMLKTPEDALSVFRVATAKEQDAIVQTVYKKIKGATALTPKMRQEMLREFSQTAKKGTLLHSYLNQ